MDCSSKKYDVVRVVEPNPGVIEAPVGHWLVETHDGEGCAKARAAEMNETRTIPQWTYFRVVERGPNVFHAEW